MFTDILSSSGSKTLYLYQFSCLTALTLVTYTTKWLSINYVLPGGIFLLYYNTNFMMMHIMV